MHVLDVVRRHAETVEAQAIHLASCGHTVAAAELFLAARHAYEAADILERATPPSRRRPFFSLLYLQCKLRETVAALKGVL